MIKQVFLGAAGALAITGSAFAADLGPARAPLAPVFTWSGFYVGANVGYIGSDNGSTVGTTGLTNLGLGGAVATANSLNQSVSGSTKGLSALLGGGQIGYNYQMGAIVLGLETDIQSSTRSKTVRSFVTPTVGFPDPTVGTATNTQRYNYLGTVRGRIGYLWTPSLLVFATGGLAYGEKHDTNDFQTNRINVNIPPSFATVSRSSTRTGYTVGGGIEYALDQSWSVKAEALYYDLGNKSGTGSVLLLGAANAPFVSSTVRASGHDRGIIARAGLNYKFNWF